MSTFAQSTDPLELEQPVQPESEPKAEGGFKSLLGRRNFRLLWIGEGISLVGDQFYLIALPWLVLQMTGDALVMGSVLALAGIPRALFMLVGGAFTDRFTPRIVMLASNLLRMALVAFLAVLVLGAALEVWMLYLFALAFGLLDAFFFPAQNAIVPPLVKEGELQSANALIQGTMQLSMFLGPVLAGVLIAALDSQGAGQGSGGSVGVRGIGVAFLIDALTFLASAVTLWLIRTGGTQPDAGKERDGLLGSIGQALRYVWDDISLRTFFLLIAVSNFLINGPLIVGIPVLANDRFPEGAAAFGILMSAYGGGSLLGIALAGLLPRPPDRRMGIVLGVIWSGLGLGVVGLGLAGSTPLAALVITAMGVANGYVVILFVTWLQIRTAQEMLGRMMSLLMFASAGLLPLSTVLTGVLISQNAVGLFVVSGFLMTAIVLLTLLNPAVRSMEGVRVPVSGSDRPDMG